MPDDDYAGVEDGAEILDDVLQQKEIYRFEGEQGTRNLARIAGMLGYHDTQYFGQFEDGCYGDLFEFFNDNPGAIEVVVEWIRDQLQEQKPGGEWYESLKEYRK